MNLKSPPSSAYQAVHVLTVILTLIVVFGGVHFWFPEHIALKSAQVLKPLEQQLAVKKEDTKVVSQSLLDYISELRLKEEKERDEKIAKELELKQLEVYSEDFSDTARDILASRFKLPETDEGFSGADEFVTPEEIKDRVDFWTYMFGVYTLDHTIFYNAENPGIVYSVLDFTELSAVGGDKSFKSQMISDERNRILKMIKTVSARLSDSDLKLAGLNKHEQRLAKLLMKNNDHVDVSENGLMNSLKMRNGFAHRIKTALVESGRYMSEMQRIFSERGLPVELTMIPFIESSFNLNAYSHAGAAGIWQFIEATGKRYLRIDEYVDERFDPILAAYAAATHLTHEYKMLGSWPQTINAYNTGPGRLLQAKKQLGTDDISKIIKYFKGAGYGPDSKNYFPEFLAMVHVYNNQMSFFGDINPKPLEQFEYVALPAPTNLKDLAFEAGLPLSKIREMNLTLKPDVASGQKSLPKGYLIKIPKEAKDNVLLALQQITSETVLATHHIVRRGDSLKKIARMYDVELEDLSELNAVFPNEKLRSGAIIELPGRPSEYSTMQQSDQLITPDNVANPIF